MNNLLANLLSAARRFLRAYDQGTRAEQQAALSALRVSARDVALELAALEEQERNQ